MLRLLLIIVLSVPIPPQSPLVYSVHETIDDVSHKGTYNVTVVASSSKYKIYEYRDVGSEGSNVTFVESASRFGPGILRYPVLFFDPNEKMNTIWRLVEKRLNKRNGTRENSSINIQHKTIYLGENPHGATVIYYTAKRVVENVTETFEASYILIDDYGITYYLSYKVVGRHYYDLSLLLKRSEEDRGYVSVSAAVLTLVLGMIVSLTIARLMVRKHRRTLR